MTIVTTSGETLDSSLPKSNGAPPRLCILTQYFPPEMGAPQVRLSELGERLIDLGWEVEALTALPNYPTGKVFSAYDPTKPVVEQVGRIRTIRVPLFTAKSGFTKRLRSYFSFVRSAKKFGPQLCNKPDLLFVESPPLFIGYAARSLSKRWRCPYVFNISDLWPESAIRMGVVKPGLATWLAERLELSLYRHAAGVTGQSSAIIDSIRARSPNTSTFVLTNGCDPNRFGPQFVDDDSRELVGREPGIVFIYAGLLGLAQGLDQILDIAKQLPRDVAARFVLVGEGPERERLAARIRDEQIDRVRLVAAQPRERVPALLAASDVALITLGMSIPGAVPSKVYEAMGSQLPILLIADGEAAERVQRAQAGIAVPTQQLSAALEAVVRLSTDPGLRARMGIAARQAAETEYNRDRIVIGFDHYLRSMLTSRQK